MSHRPSKKYSWHPSHRPPPAEAIKSARIARISPVGRSLETALAEIQAEDEHTLNDGNNNCDEMCQSVGSTATMNCPVENDFRGTKRKIFCEKKAEDIVRENGGEPNNSKQTNVSESRSNRQKSIILDESFAQSILDTYCTSFAQSSFENNANERNDNAAMTHRSKITKENSSAPAVMLQGEIDHYNRIGGQWRIVVKNATIRLRTVVESDNGLDGISKRYRHVLDWRGDACNQTFSKFGLNNSDDEKIIGKIQILAYDDEDYSMRREN
mmetsp:Transcript_29560/g.61365  ORF Transcript_29560/g.61365 Transcript_29560/m.61365 type:complete len:269 (-) Transcript_29560:131-937(-)|eukprot:CAMPEP_0171441236 /NCGR_PEP_ID=MMETSP0881-20121228/24741_1 /TAXON_ID=67004 /ORGANISM="Thalassiosira weissflogii, Strain CCMP1336" /LENGTH=268 /DNA_ID=CAMNT_0011963919 /DNA_START=140 /DNA_END=946 /DNA_ORIENTATION=-